MKTFPQGRPPTLTFCNKWFDWLMNWLIILHMNLPKIFSTTAEREKEFFSQDFGIIFHSFHYRIRRDWGMEEGGHYGVASTKGRVLSNSRIINLNCSPCSVRSTSICTFSRLKKKLHIIKRGFKHTMRQSICTTTVQSDLKKQKKVQYLINQKSSYKIWGKMTN